MVYGVQIVSLAILFNVSRVCQVFSSDSPHGTSWHQVPVEECSAKILSLKEAVLQKLIVQKLRETNASPLRVLNETEKPWTDSSCA